MNKQKRVLVVAGMHRSGTSSVSGTLALLGASLPRTLMTPSPENPRGYFESTAIADLNDRILADCGTSWKDWRAVDNAWEINPRAPAYLAAARELLATEYGAADFIVLKDPRLARILPFWKLVLAEEGYECLHVIPLRHPDMVARSLRARTPIGKATAHMLWLRHLVDVELYSRGQKRVFVCWNEFLGDWERQAGHIAAVLGFSWPRLNDRARAEVAEFLSADLQHHHEPHRFGSGSLVANDYVQRIYRALSAMIDDPYADTALQTFDAVRSEQAYTEGLYGPLLADYQLTAKRLAAGFFGQDEVTDDLSAPANDMEALLGAAATEHRAAVQRGEALAGELQASRAHADNLQARVNEVHAHATGLEAQLHGAASARAAAESRAEALSGELTGAREEVVQLQGRAVDLQGQLQAMSSERDALRRQAMELADRAERCDAQARSLLAQVSELESRQAAARLEHQEAESRIQRLTTALDRLQRERDEERLDQQLAERRTVDDVLALDGLEFIEAAYDALLKRPPDDAGRDAYLARLQRGTPKIQILWEIHGSDEAKLRGVRLRGLEEAVRRHWYLRVPVLGSVARLLSHP